MKKEQRCILVFILFLVMIKSPLIAQFNLVKNPSFEQFSICPNSSGQINRAISWSNPLYQTTPDYFNACDTSSQHFAGVPRNYTGYEFARTGDAYAGVATYIYNNINPAQNNYREYIQGELVDSLNTGIEYCVEFYVSATDSSRYISNDIGIYFSPFLIQDSCLIFPPSTCPLAYIPQVENPPSNNLNLKNGWTKVSGNYLANGGEKYFIIGNFKDSSATTATSTGWPTLPQNRYAAYYLDDILVAPCDSLNGIEEYNLDQFNLRVYPSPTRNEIFIDSDNEDINQICIYSMLGQCLKNEYIKNKTKKILIDITKYSVGVYELIVYSEKHKYFLKIIKQ